MTTQYYSAYTNTLRDTTLHNILIHTFIEQIHINVTSNTYQNTEQSSVVISGINTAIDEI